MISLIGIAGSAIFVANFHVDAGVMMKKEFSMPNTKPNPTVFLQCDGTV